MRTGILLALRLSTALSGLGSLLVGYATRKRRLSG